MKRVLSDLLCGGLLVTLAATGAQAQATAQITGTVKDPSGGVLPGASVSVTQTDTGFKREVVTDADGLFSFPSIPIGPYRLEVMLQGFRTSVQTGIMLQVNANPVVPVTMALGEVAETITVQANAQVVETRNLGVGQVMDNSASSISTNGAIRPTSCISAGVGRRCRFSRAASWAAATAGRRTAGRRLALA